MRVRASERWFTEHAQCRADLPERASMSGGGGRGEGGGVRREGVSQPMNNHYTTESSREEGGMRSDEGQNKRCKSDEGGEMEGNKEGLEPEEGKGKDGGKKQG